MCDCSSIAVADTCTQCCTVCYTNIDADSVTITCANGTALVVSDCRPVTCTNCEAIKRANRDTHKGSHCSTVTIAHWCPLCGTNHVKLTCYIRRMCCIW